MEKMVRAIKVFAGLGTGSDDASSVPFFLFLDATKNLLHFWYEDFLSKEKNGNEENFLFL